MGRLGRYRNRNWARKNIPNSWDRDLSIGDVEWSIGRKSKLEKGPRDKNGPKIDARVLLEKHVSLGARFLLSKHFFCQNFDRFWCSRVVAKFWFLLFDFFDFVIFPRFWILANFAPKVAATLSGSNKNRLSGAIKYSNWYYSIFESTSRGKTSNFCCHKTMPITKLKTSRQIIFWYN